MSEIEFFRWPKIPRLRRSIYVTEKIDGTNAAVVVRDLNNDSDEVALCEQLALYGDSDGTKRALAVRAQSRKRIITPDDDNHGFATWVWNNASELAEYLGPGVHHGEWWGKGINRGYGLDHNRFSLFNTRRWFPAIYETPLRDIGVHVVPTISFSTFDTNEVDAAIHDLQTEGSWAAPGFMEPEGVVIYHSASGHMYKRLIHDDDIPKSQHSDPSLAVFAVFEDTTPNEWALAA